jgi:hypothetical protein
MVVMFVVLCCDCVMQSHSLYVEKYQSITSRYVFCLYYKVKKRYFVPHIGVHHTGSGYEESV